MLGMRDEVTRCFRRKRVRRSGRRISVRCKKCQCFREHLAEAGGPDTEGCTGLSPLAVRSNFTAMKQSIVTSSPETLSGTPVFTGTRVPVQTLIDYLEGGQTIDDFLEGFPTVAREQVIAFLDEAMEQVVAQAS